MRFLAGIGILLIAGCGNSDRALTSSVTGTVTLNGKPVSKGQIVFETTGARPANGRIANGRIVEMTTYEPNDGAPVGNHHVAVFVTTDGASAVTASPGEAGKFDPNYMGGTSLIPRQYNDPYSSGLTAEVKPDGRNNFSFELRSP